jgi:hypothetical protein
MNRQKIIILGATMLLMALTAVALAHYHAHQRLGKPGVKTGPLPGSANLEVLLPEKVLDFTSKKMDQAKAVFEMLPKDTSFGQRIYKSADGWPVQLNVVLMGADRTSLHKPQICMPGQGVEIEKTEVVNVPISQPRPYDLPVIKLTISKKSDNPQTEPINGLFLYWFVTDGMVSADRSALRRMWLSSKELFLTGQLQRWAYVTCFAPFPRGQEEAYLKRLETFLADAVPQFQLATGTPATMLPHIEKQK